MTQHVDSASDDRTANNAVRHAYRVLSEAEKANMLRVKDAGAAFLALLDEVTPPELAGHKRGPDGKEVPIYRRGHSREVEIARQRVEEAVMWAVKAITA